MTLYLAITANAAWADATTSLFTINLAALGCTIPVAQYFGLFADGGNNIIEIVVNTNGLVQSVDSTLGRGAGVASGNQMNCTISIIVD